MWSGNEGRRRGTQENWAGNLHGDWLLEFSAMLNLVHEISAVDELHHKVQAILEMKGKNVYKMEKITPKKE